MPLVELDEDDHQKDEPYCRVVQFYRIGRVADVEVHKRPEKKSMIRPLERKRAEERRNVFWKSWEALVGYVLCSFWKILLQ